MDEMNWIPLLPIMIIALSACMLVVIVLSMVTIYMFYHLKDLVNSRVSELINKTTLAGELAGRLAERADRREEETREQSGGR